MNSPMDAYRYGIASVESGGDYGTLGPRTRSGDRAYGKYQVMGNNIPSWTQEALGRAYTPQEFLADKQAQDATFDHHFGKSVQKYGNPQDAASVWFTGRPQAQGGSSSDGYINGNEYVSRFNKGVSAYSGDDGSSAASAPAQTAISQAMNKQGGQGMPNPDDTGALGYGPGRLSQGGIGNGM